MTYAKFVTDALGRIVEEKRGKLLVMPGRAPRVHHGKLAKVLEFRAAPHRGHSTRR